MSKEFSYKARQIRSGYDRKEIVHGINIDIPEHKISVIIGANACGKSTLLKTMSRLIKPYSGELLINDSPITDIPSKKLAQILGLLPQTPIVPEGIKVSDLVGRGRYPHQTLFKGWTKADYDAVAEALEIMGIEELANSSIDELSGGQRQRVWIAMALAQQTDILFLDEPTTYLDITYQVEILDLLTDLNRRKGTTIVMVLHDINLSVRYADYIFALKKGELVAQGVPTDIVNEELIENVFGLKCIIIDDPVSKTPFIVPKGRHHA